MRTIFKKIVAYILQAESQLVVWKYKPKIVAITGSIGKTSTKDTIYAVLSGISYVRKSEKSYNSEIGLPLTILGCPNGWNNFFVWLLNIFKGLWLFVWPHKYPDWLVLEAGVGKPNDMRHTASWLKTDAVVITAIGETPAHIEFFDSHKHLVEEKSGLIKTLKKDGLLVLNNDDEIVSEMRAKTKNRVITFGFRKSSDIICSDDSISYNDAGIPHGIIFRIEERGSSLPVAIEGAFGKNHVYASLGALALSSGLKFNMLKAIEALKNYNAPPGRMRLLRGMNNSLIIDDTYNSSPSACESVLKTLSEIKTQGRKIAILGDMLELGTDTEQAHQEVGEAVVEYGVDYLITVGEMSRDIVRGAIAKGMARDCCFNFKDSIEAGKFLQQRISEGDLILVKGSQGVRMEKVVKELMAEPQKAAELLVRQDKEWIK